MEFKTNMTRAMEMESAVKSLGTKRFAENATHLGTKMTCTGTTTDGTIFTKCVQLKMTYGFYQVTGVGSTEQTACTDCMIKTNALLGQQLGFAQTYRHSLPVDGEGNGDFLDDMKVVLDVARFSQKQTTNSLKLLQHFVAEDPTAAQVDSSMKRLQGITKILGGLVSYECAPRNGVHVTKCLFLDYCSTGLGPSVKESKSQAASEMLYLLKQTVGLQVEVRDGRPLLCLPAVDKLKAKTLKYFLMAPRECVSPERRLREIATVVDSALEYHVHRSVGHVVRVEYRVNACRASVTGDDEPSCKRRCQTEMLLELQTWCGFNLVTGCETVRKCYKGLSENGPRPDEQREETTRQNVEFLDEASERRTADGVKVLENDNVNVQNNDRERRNADSRPSSDDQTESSVPLAERLAETRRVLLSPFAKTFKQRENVSNPSQRPGVNGGRSQSNYNVPPTLNLTSNVHGQNSFYTTSPYRVVENNHYGQRYYQNTYDPSASGFHAQRQGENISSNISSITNPSYHAVENGVYTLFRFDG